MSIRRAGATVTATLLTVLAGFVGATSAFAYLPPPDDGTSGPGNVPAAPVTSAPGSSHTLTWVLVSLAILAAVVVVLASVRFVTRHPWRHGTPKVA